MGSDIVAFGRVMVGFLCATVLIASLLTAQTTDRYVVTASPINVGVVSGALCIAVDTHDQQGVWWWEPGRSGCSSRSTGPGVFHAEQAKVSLPTSSGSIKVSFRMPLHSIENPFTDVRLVLEAGGMRAMASGVRVPTESRRDLAIPESPREPGDRRGNAGQIRANLRLGAAPVNIPQAVLPMKVSDLPARDQRALSARL